MPDDQPSERKRGEPGDAAPSQRPRVISQPAPRHPRQPVEMRGGGIARSTTPPEARPGSTDEPPRPPVSYRRLSPDLELREVRSGSRPGTRYVRTMMAQTRSFQKVERGVLRATNEAVVPRTGLSRFTTGLRRKFIGSPLASSALAHERLTNIKALAVFSSDALSSVAYATEQILVVLIAAGTGALSNVLPVSIGIIILLALVGISYRQTIHAYPNGGGSYIVAHSELGVWPGLIAAGSLMVDYVLTVAVSISSGVQAVTSAVESLHPYTVEIALAALLFMVIVNLRGVKESGSIFAAPTYVFILSILVMIGVAFFKIISHGASPISGGEAQQGEHLLKSTGEGIGIFLILRAFASGCTAMTGVEAISNGVPAFKPPESDNARATLTWMAGILGVMFLGIGILAHHYGIVPDDPTVRGAQTVLSKIAHAAFGQGNNPFYIITQSATFLILVLAANTSFADFPRLASILAHDGYMPHQFSFRGDRLGFSNGIIVLGMIAAVLLIAFKANTDALIPLYAVGVFISFTLSQSGMVRHWLVRRKRGGDEASNATRSLYINGAGAVVTGIVAIVIAVTKFIHGAWIVIILIPIIVLILRAIGRHYESVEREIEVSDDELRDLRLQAPAQQTVIVPVGTINRAVVDTLNYALSISNDVTAVHVTDDLDEAHRLQNRWEDWAPDVPLVILESPYRSFNGPLLSYIDFVSERRGADHMITVVLPEFVPEHWYQHILHGQTALQLKAKLLFRPNTAVVDVPKHLGRQKRSAKP